MIEINPAQVAKEAENINKLGINLESYFQKIHENVSELHSTWTGKQYVEFVTAYKGFLPNIVKMIRITKVLIPQELERKANNFYALDGQEDMRVPETPDEVYNFEDIEAQIGETISIDEQTVYGIKDQLETQINAAKDKMDEVQSKVNEITTSLWVSENSEQFRSEISSLKEAISANFDELKSGINSWISETVNAIKTADKM